MTDWEQVEKLRGKGLAWDEIAEHPKAEFKPPEGTEKPGLALKSLYFQRRSRTRRQARGGASGGGSGGRSVGEPTGWTRKKVLRTVAFVGILVALAGAIPLLLSFGVSLITALVPVLALGMVAGVGALMVAAAFTLGSARALSLWKGALISGIAVGLITSLLIATVSLSQGCPNLTPTKSGEPGPAGDTGWTRVNNPYWESGGMPVVFYLGSVACPFCSASSWAINGALRNFSTSFTGSQYGTSSPTDSYPNTPEIQFVGTSLSGTYISWDGHEGADNAQISVPSVGCPESAYVAAYDSGGGIPFVVIGGIFVHSGSFVNPQDLSPGGTPMSPQTVASQLQACDVTNPSGWTGVCAYILPAQMYIEAYLYKADQLTGAPTPTIPQSNTQFWSDLAGIT